MKLSEYLFLASLLALFNLTTTVTASMEGTLDHPVKLFSQPSFTDFTRAMESQTYDTALLQPFDFPQIVEKRGYLPLAQLSVPLASQFYVCDNKLITGQDVELRYFNAHDSCIQQVWVGAASACGTARPVIQVFERRMQAKLRPIHDTPAIPHIPFVADPRMPAADRAKLQQLIIGWSHGGWVWAEAAPGQGASFNFTLGNNSPALIQ